MIGSPAAVKNGDIIKANVDQLHLPHICHSKEGLNVLELQIPKGDILEYDFFLPRKGKRERIYVIRELQILKDHHLLLVPPERRGGGPAGALRWIIRGQGDSEIFEDQACCGQVDVALLCEVHLPSCLLLEKFNFLKLLLLARERDVNAPLHLDVQDRLALVSGLQIIQRSVSGVPRGGEPGQQ